MFGRLFGRLFQGKQSPRYDQILVVRLNARIEPRDRDGFFEVPLGEFLGDQRLGVISGGGTMLAESGEIEYCEIEIHVATPSSEVVTLVTSALERLGAPKGSKVTIPASGEEIAFGLTEGLAVYLNGTDLPPETYRECDSNHVYAEFVRLLDGEGRVLGYWEGPRETCFYLYGRSFDEMKRLLSGLQRRSGGCHRPLLRRRARSRRPLLLTLFALTAAWRELRNRGSPRPAGR